MTWGDYQIKNTYLNKYMCCVFQCKMWHCFNAKTAHDPVSKSGSGISKFCFIKLISMCFEFRLLIAYICELRMHQPSFQICNQNQLETGSSQQEKF